MLPWILVIATIGSAGCSFKRMAAYKVGDVLAAGGDTYTSDDDPELIEAALPFSLKLMESLLAVTPDHRGLLAAVTAGFAQYSWAYVQQDGDAIEDRDIDAATEHWDRARKLYLRARNYGLQGLETEYESFGDALRADPRAAVAEAGKADVDLLFWTAASWAGAIAVSKDDPDLVGDLPLVEAMIDRALELDESFDEGAIHGFLIAYEMTRQGAEGEPADRARHHFDRAVELSDGLFAGPLVTYAESVAVPQQDRETFEAMLGRALAIDVDARPEWRLANIIYQRRARWLLDRVDRLILD